MSDKLTERASAMLAANQSRRRSCVIMAIVGIAIALLVAYLLALPASSYSETPYCGKTTHEHNSECYSSVLTCVDLVDDSETETHYHSDACYRIERVLSCGIEEASEPIASEGGVGGFVNNASSDDSMIDQPDAAKTSSTPEPSHIHTEDCYSQVPSLVCALKEGEKTPSAVHVHTETCYVQKLSCDAEVHEHTLSCYSNPEVDVETTKDWEATLPSELSGVWADDLIAVAESQLGYAESDENYIVANDGKLKGYSRYGAWYGDAYGDWCAMFVSFCLNYASIPASSMPRAANCQGWIELLSSEDYQMFYPAGAYAKDAAIAISAGEQEYASLPSGVLAYYDPNEAFAPVPGDIVFFNWDSEPEADHVGIVIELIETTDNEPAKLKTIEGNASDIVKYCEYVIDDESIMGYAALPVNVEAKSIDSADYLLSENAEDQRPRDSSVMNAQKFYSGNKRFYQVSPFAMGGMVVTFGLIPSLDGGIESLDYDYLPKEWTADANTNYMVAYCVDHDTMWPAEGTEYDVWELDNSRFTDPDTRQALENIVAHSYPFISADQMKDELIAAGCEITDECCEAELMTAVQLAIWKTANPYSKLMDVTYNANAFEGIYIDGVINGLGESSVKHTENDHVYAIAEYLLNLNDLPDLEADWSSSSEKLDDDLYNLTVNVRLNRAIGDNEKVTARLLAGSSASSELTVEEGGMLFSLKLDGLTAEEVALSSVQLMVEEAHMQVYVYDSASNQDLIGGNWEVDKHDLSFVVGSGETSVEVFKVWENDEPGASSVEVQLLANGVKSGAAVALNSDNDWSYTWNGLQKHDPLGKEISYTVSEVPLAGYVSKVEHGEASSGRKTWRALSQGESLQEGGKYLIVSYAGALTWQGGDSSKMTWSRVSLTNATNVSPNMMWVVETSDMGITSLKNLGKNERLVYRSNMFQFYDGTGTWQECDFNYENGVLKGVYENIPGFPTTAVTRYFVGVDQGECKTSNSSSSAIPLKVYELVDAEEASSPVSYVITNYKADPAVDPVEVSVEKAWVGAGQHPESVTVYLLKDGERYGAPVELNAENNWSHTWENLPVKLASSDAIFEYTVEEVPVEGYESEVTLKPGSANSYLITNTSQNQYVLPETGGEGACCLMVAGASLLIMGLIGCAFRILRGRGGAIARR